jgi:hypothetical protein
MRARARVCVCMCCVGLCWALVAVCPQTATSAPVLGPARCPVPQWRPFTPLSHPHTLKLCHLCHTCVCHTCHTCVSYTPQEAVLGGCHGAAAGVRQPGPGRHPDSGRAALLGSTLAHVAQHRGCVRLRPARVCVASCCAAAGRPARRTAHTRTRAHAHGHHMLLSLAGTLSADLGSSRTQRARRCPRRQASPRCARPWA